MLMLIIIIVVIITTLMRAVEQQHDELLPQDAPLVGPPQVRFGSVMLGSVRFGSSRFGSFRLGSVRFGSSYMMNCFPRTRHLLDLCRHKRSRLLTLGIFNSAIPCLLLWLVIFLSFTSLYHACTFTSFNSAIPCLLLLLLILYFHFLNSNFHSPALQTSPCIRRAIIN